MAVENDTQNGPDHADPAERNGAGSDAAHAAEQHGDRSDGDGAADAGEQADDKEGDKGPKSMAEALAKGIEEVGGGRKKTTDEGDDEEAEPAAKPAKSGPSLKEVQAKKDQQAGKPAAEKPGEPKVGDQSEQPPAPMDPINDPIPAYVKGKTRERMVSLIETGKQLTTRVAEVESQRNEILGLIEQTKATPDQYGAALDYLADVNSGDPKRIERAAQTMMAELRALSGMLGKPLPGVDLTVGHADLQADVRAGKITLQHAQEIAAGRALREQQAQIGERTAATEQATAEVRRGQTDLNALEVELRGADPFYEAKARQIIPLLKPLFETIPPSQWAGAFRKAYAQVPNPVPQRAAVPQSNGNGNNAGGHQPLRARSVAGSTTKPPDSMLEAMNAGLDAVANRR